MQWYQCHDKNRAQWTDRWSWPLPLKSMSWAGKKAQWVKYLMSWFLFLFVCLFFKSSYFKFWVCVRVRLCMHKCKCSRRPEALDPMEQLKLETAVSCLMWVQGMKLRHLEEQYKLLTCKPPHQSWCPKFDPKNQWEKNKNQMWYAETGRS